MPTSRDGHLQARGLVALILLLVLAPVLASALLPDASWVGGLFDAADEDGLLAPFGDPGLAPRAAAMPGRPLPCGSVAVNRQPAEMPCPAARSFVSRAPPAA